jgi:hypothetical protein
VDKAGNVFASWGGITGGVVCQLGATAPNGYTPDACKAIYATLLASRLTGQQVVGYFNDNSNCQSQTWTWLTGLYWGPAPGY